MPTLVAQSVRWRAMLNVFSWTWVVIGQIITGSGIGRSPKIAVAVTAIWRAQIPLARAFAPRPGTSAPSATAPSSAP